LGAGRDLYKTGEIIIFHGYEQKNTSFEKFIITPLTKSIGPPENIVCSPTD
jgi:hypothetical protein